MKNLLLLSIVLTFAYTFGDVPRGFTNGHAGFQFYHANKQENKANNIAPNLVLDDDRAEDEDVDFADSITRKQYASPPERHKSNTEDNTIKANIDNKITTKLKKEPSRVQQINAVDSLEISTSENPFNKIGLKGASKRNITITKMKKSDLKTTTEIPDNKNILQITESMTSSTSKEVNENVLINDNAPENSKTVVASEKANKRNNALINVSERYKQIYRRHKPFDDIKSNITEANINTHENSVIVKKDVQSNFGNYGSEISHKLPNINRPNFLNRFRNKIPSSTEKFLNLRKSESDQKVAHGDVVILTDTGENITNSQIYMTTKDSNDLVTTPPENERIQDSTTQTTKIANITKLYSVQTIMNKATEASVMITDNTKPIIKIKSTIDRGNMETTNQQHSNKTQTTSEIDTFVENKLTTTSIERVSSTERAKESLTASPNNHIEVWKRPQTLSFSRRRLPYKNYVKTNSTTVAPPKLKVHTTANRRTSFKGYSRKSYTRKPSVTTTTKPHVLKKPVNMYNNFNRTNKLKVKMNSRNMTSISKGAVTKSPNLNLYMRKPSDKFIQMHKLDMIANITTTSERSARPQRHLSIPYLFYRRKLRS